MLFKETIACCLDKQLQVSQTNNTLSLGCIFYSLEFFYYWDLNKRFDPDDVFFFYEIVEEQLYIDLFAIIAHAPLSVKGLFRCVHTGDRKGCEKSLRNG
jgi:hypothetical protein